MFLKRRISTLLLGALVLSVIALSFFIVTPKAHAEVTAEELGQLQAQVDVITQVVQKLTATNGQVLGVSATLPVKYFETTVVESGDKRALSPDGLWWQGGKDMQMKRLQLQIEMYMKQITELTKKLSVAEEQLKKLSEGTSSSTPSKGFTIADIKSVTFKYIDPIPNAADDEYTLYTIILTSGKKIEVKMCGYCLDENRTAAFRKAGYKGDMDALYDMAQKQKGDSTSESKPTPRFNGFTYPDKSNKVEASLAFGRPKDGGPAVTGPVLRGTVNWGDGIIENVNALVNEEFNKVTHTYKKTGKFTIVITNATDKKTAKKEVVIVPQVIEI